MLLKQNDHIMDAWRYLIRNLVAIASKKAEVKKMSFQLKEGGAW